MLAKTESNKSEQVNNWTKIKGYVNRRNNLWKHKEVSLKRCDEEEKEAGKKE